MPDRRGPLPAWAAPLAWPLARAYGAGVEWRNARFDRGIGVRRLDAGFPASVISIGNMTAGGTGKSPFVAWCARELLADGAKPVIALRGYRASRRADRAGSAAPLSDEAEEYRLTAPGAEIVVSPRRREALEARLRGSPREDARRDTVVLLDDGFQHRQLARDLDIVLVDATRPGLDGDLLPRGWLREPARNIARAGIVVVTKADDPGERARAAELVAAARGAPHDAVCVHAWKSIAIIEPSTAARTVPVESLSSVKAVSACALGNPAHFHAMVERAGATVLARVEKPDHRAFDAEELERAARRVGAAMIVLSRKDLVKCGRLPAIPIAVPELAVSFLEGDARVRAAINACRRRPA